MELTITSEHIAMAKLAGACSVRGITVGKSITSLSAEHLAWFEAKYPRDSGKVAVEIAKAAGCDILGSVSLTICAGSGDGDGSGHGYGDGYGYGSGYGYGYGDGDGSGGSRT